jgi:hypothetical protein
VYAEENVRADASFMLHQLDTEITANPRMGGSQRIVDTEPEV